jgi:hypothetical protein
MEYLLCVVVGFFLGYGVRSVGHVAVSPSTCTPRKRI